MMMNSRTEQAAVAAATLEDILSRYHGWAKAYRGNHQVSQDPMFRNAKSAGRHWDSTAEVIEDELANSTMQTVDFHIGEMQDPHRTAIYVLARNLYTGRSVWMSPRLPQDPVERSTVVAEARNQLTRRLSAAGVM